MTFKGGQLKRLANTQQVEDVTLLARRGTITDRNGAPLAVSEDAATVFATPYLVKNPVRTAAQLAPLLGERADDILEDIADRSNGFVYLARKIPGTRRRARAQAEAARHRSARRHAPDLSAEDARRPGARARSASTTRACSGLEQELEDDLHGADGEQRITRDARGDAGVGGPEVRTTVPARTCS